MSTRKHLAGIVPAAAAAAVAFVFTGCDKNSMEDLEFLSSARPASQTASETKAADIFDEFYIEDPKAQVAAVTAPQPAQPAAAATVAPPAPTSAPAPRAAATAPQQPSRPAAPAAQARPQQQPAPARASGTHNFTPGGHYVVQVYSTASRAGANRLAARVKGMGFPAYIIEVQNPTPTLTGTFYRVRIGDFDSQISATAFGESALKPAGLDYWVDRKANDRLGVRIGAETAPAPAQAAAAPARPQQTAPAAQPAAAPAKQAAPAATQPAAPAPAKQAAPAATKPAPKPAAPASDLGADADDW